MDRPIRPTSLTAHLARAAEARDPSWQDDSPATSPASAMTTTEAPAPAGADEHQCSASVVSGQRCRRLAQEDGELCAGHAAMAGRPMPKMRAIR